MTGRTARWLRGIAAAWVGAGALAACGRYGPPQPYPPDRPEAVEEREPPRPAPVPPPEAEEDEEEEQR
jgi:hypothetical protein